MTPFCFFDGLIESSYLESKLLKVESEIKLIYINKDIDEFTLESYLKELHHKMLELYISMDFSSIKMTQLQTLQTHDGYVYDERIYQYAVKGDRQMFSMENRGVERHRFDVVEDEEHLYLKTYYTHGLPDLEKELVNMLKEFQEFASINIEYINKKIKHYIDALATQYQRIKHDIFIEKNVIARIKNNDM